jgi:hypothetical protein
MCVGRSPKDIWIDQVASVLDMYYSDRWAWHDPDVCLTLTVLYLERWRLVRCRSVLGHGR